MKKLHEKLWAKIIAVLLASLFTSCLAAACIGIVYLQGSDVYGGGKTQLTETACASTVYSIMYQLASDYQSGDLDTADYAPALSNLSFTISDEAGNELCSNYQTDDPLCTFTNTYSFETVQTVRDVTHTFETESEREAFVQGIAQEYPVEVLDYTSDAGGYTVRIIYHGQAASAALHVTARVVSDRQANDAVSTSLFWFEKLYALRYTLIWVAAAALVLTLIPGIFCLCAAGHKEGVEGIHANWVDRIPFDLYLVLLLALGALCCTAFYIGWEGLVLPVVFWPPLLLSLCMTFATRCKLGSWWKNTVIYYVFRFCWRLLRRLWRGIYTALSHLSLTWRALLLCGILVLLTAFLLLDGHILLWLVLMAALTVTVMILAVAAHQVEQVGRELADGNMSAKVDTSHMFGALKRHGESLNRIQGGIQTAVEARMKSEHLKTELITNVSHDIKTPLTSIINYVDLLKKEPMSSDAAREYLDVLDRQSARLKKLIEDLVEASKASTGNIPVHLENTDLNVLLSQAGAEYESKFDQLRLEPVWSLSDAAPHIMADGKLLWRVLDNLMNNICKYALEGTRVYFSTEQADGRVSVMMKNVSRSALNISSDELMERFVRGDASRNTEGSGLGLSIAKSLTELQHGAFSLEIDGDLFKAKVTFDAAVPEGGDA